MASSSELVWRNGSAHQLPEQVPPLKPRGNREKAIRQAPVKVELSA